jgi:cephalosporin-C deacetylase
MKKSLLLAFLFLSLFNNKTVFGAAAFSTHINSDKGSKKEKLTETMDVKIIPQRKNGLFDAKNHVKYKVTIFNYYKSNQEGKVTIEVKTDKGGVVGISESDIKIKGGSRKSIDYEIPVNDPGFYDLIFKINTNDYDDTIRNVFGYKPLEINTPVHKPEDFEEFWRNTLKELRGIDPEYSVKLDPIQSTVSHSVYYVQMKSLDGVTIHGWLTVPKIPGKYPTMIGLPGCKVVLTPLYADDFVLFLLNIRDSKAEGEEILEKETDFALYNIENKEKYIYRGVYMDCIRAIDFLFAYKDLGLGIDTSRISLVGGSQGGALAFITSALDHRVKACVADNPIYCDIHNLIPIQQVTTPVEWPTKAYKEYLQKSPGLTMKNIMNTLDYFDPQNFMPMIKCPILLGLGSLDKLAPPATIFTTYNKLSESVKKKSEVHCFSYLAHEVAIKHRHFQNQWTLEKLVYPKRN